MPDDAPAVRGLYMKDCLVSLEALPGDAGARVREADPELFEIVESARRTQWLPVEVNVRMVDAVIGVLGAERGGDFFATNLHRQFDTPTWRSFIEGGIALLGLDPGSMLKWLPQAYGIIFRDCGAWSIETRTDEEIILLFEDLPGDLVNNQRWMDSIRAGLISVFLLAGVSGSARYLEIDPDAGSARLCLRWKTDE